MAVIDHRELAEQMISPLTADSEAARLARSVRRAKARTLRHNRKVALRLARAAKG